jgi:hypothetical protein
MDGGHGRAMWGYFKRKGSKVLAPIQPQSRKLYAEYVSTNNSRGRPVVLTSP